MPKELTSEYNSTRKRHMLVAKLLAFVVALTVSALFVLSRTAGTNPALSVSGPSMTPIIQTPLEPPPGTPVQINVTVAYSHRIINVTLMLSVDGSEWFPMRMGIVEGDFFNGTYSATIPAHALNTTVRYYVLVFDEVGYNLRSNTNTYVVRYDTAHPVESIKPIGGAIEGETPTLTVFLNDTGTGVSNATVYYWTDAKPLEMYNVSMRLVQGSIWNGTYEAQLPSQKAGTSVSYYVEVYDLAGNRLEITGWSYEVFAIPEQSCGVRVLLVRPIDMKEHTVNVSVEFSAFIPSLSRPDLLNVWWGTYNQHYLSVNNIERFTYRSNSSEIETLTGIPELYPFDSYTIDLTFTVENWPFSEKEVKMADILLATETIVPDWQWSPVDPKYETAETLRIVVGGVFTRNPWAVHLTVTMPILACFFLLGGTAALDSRKHLDGRLLVYFSVFVFAVGFPYSLAPSLPRRIMPSVAELLLGALVVDTVIFSILSILTNLSKNGQPLDWIAAVSTLIITLSFMYLPFVQRFPALTLNITSSLSPVIVLIAFALLFGVVAKRVWMRVTGGNKITPLPKD